MRTEMQALRGHMRSEMTGLRGDVRTEMQALRGELSLLKWMGGILVGLAIAILLRVFLVQTQWWKPGRRVDCWTCRR